MTEPMVGMAQPQTERARSAAVVVRPDQIGMCFADPTGVAASRTGHGPRISRGVIERTAAQNPQERAGGGDGRNLGSRGENAAQAR